MPTYSLKCANDHCYESQHGINLPHPPCPTCGTVEVEWVPQPTGFVLKGSGWAASGYSSGPRVKGTQEKE